MKRDRSVTGKLLASDSNEIGIGAPESKLGAAKESYRPLWHEELQLLLARAYSYLEKDDALNAFRLLGPELTALYLGVSNEKQSNLLDEFVLYASKHQIAEAIMQDPYSARARIKPRGYAGDAVMLDFVYDSPRLLKQLTGLGRTVFQGTTEGPMGRSITYRRDLLRSHILNVISSRRAPRILSVASGHCRELEDTPLEHSNAAHFVALDQDPESCSWTARRFGDHLRVVNESFRKLLRSEFLSGGFDLIYTAGLFDYLDDRIASALFRALSERLVRGGLLVIGNFAASAIGIGYMETFLEWKLIYRTPDELIRLGEGVHSDIRLENAFLDAFRNVAYVEWRRSD